MTDRKRSDRRRRERSLRVARWTEQRDTHHGRLPVMKGHQPTIDTRVERAAWAKSMAALEVAS